MLLENLAIETETLRRKSESVTRRAGIYKYDDLLMLDFAGIILAVRISSVLSIVKKNWTVRAITQYTLGRLMSLKLHHDPSL